MPINHTSGSSLNLKTLLQWTPDLYLILNPNFTIAEVSAAYEKATLVKRKDILGRNIFEIFPDNPNDQTADGVSNLRRSLERVLKNKKSDTMAVQKYDLRIPGSEKFEERFWSPVNLPILDKNKRVKYIIHRVEDVTEFIRLKQASSAAPVKDLDKIETEVYKRAQEIQQTNEELRLSEERFRLLVEGSKDYAILMLDINGFITTWNAGAERIKGYKADEIIGKHFSIFYTEDARAAHHPEDELKKAKEEGRYEEEGWRIRKDGSRFWADVIITPIYDDKANLIGFGKVTRDLTEYRKSEQLKKEFVSVVSHELRTPLTSIRGSISLLIGGAAGQFSEKGKNLLDIASVNCDRLNALINDILDMEKIEAGKMKFLFKPYDIGKLVTEAIEINKMYGEKFGVHIICSNIPSNLIVNVDTDRLIQVLSNLISNAAKFSIGGGFVIVSVVKHNTKVRVAVTNRGVGISEEFKNRIFERFSQADASETRVKGGTGLGLAISKAIIERLGGTIQFTSVPNEETTFYIDLPLHHNIQELVDTLVLDERNTPRILICEDEEDQANYLSTLLQGAGYQTEICFTGAQVKQMLSERSYFALLLDLVLPDINGIDLIKELRNSDKANKTPIIIISVLASESKKILQGNVLEVVDWLDKPLDFNKLAKAFSEIQKHIKTRQPRVLHIEDDTDIQKVIRNLLEYRSEVTSVGTVDGSRKLLTKQNFDLVILDLLLSDGHGTQLLPLIAEKKTPVIVFASDMLDPKYSSYVKQTLIKSQTPIDKLMETINSLLKKNSKQN